MAYSDIAFYDCQLRSGDKRNVAFPQTILRGRYFRKETITLLRYFLAGTCGEILDMTQYGDRSL